MFPLSAGFSQVPQKSLATLATGATPATKSPQEEEWFCDSPRFSFETTGAEKVLGLTQADREGIGINTI